MNIKRHFALTSSILKGHVNRYAILGLIISLTSILLASMLVSYQLTGRISLEGMIAAQTSNPAIWALDITPFMFAYWGQSFCYELASKAESIIEDKTREMATKSGDLELKLKYESNHDSLTNLPNNRLLSQRMNQAIQQIQKGEELALIVLAIRNFKEINYNFGNFSANSLLLQFTEKLKSILLEPYMLQAYMGMNMLARLQAAEFAILIPRLRKEHNLEDILSNIIEDTSVNFMIDGSNLDIQTTAGVALYPNHGKNDEELLNHAMMALFHAEKENQPHAVYEATMSSNYKAKPMMLKELTEAIEHAEIEILLQADFNLAEKKIIGAETVLNFDHTKYGMFNNEKFAEVVEGTPLVKNLTLYALQNAIKQLARWQHMQQPIYMRTYLYSMDMALPGLIEELIKKDGVPPPLLNIELTEKTCLGDQTRSINVLNQLAALGVTITISDFASGYSSFLYLTNFPINEIKIDKSFVINMMKDEKKHSIVRAIIKLAESMNLTVVADGIPDENTLQGLLELGCKIGNGPHLAQAMRMHEFNQLLTAKIS